MQTDTLLDVRLDKKSVEAEGVCSFELVPMGNQNLPAFSAGAHIDVHLATADGKTLIRQYSLCNAPNERSHYAIAVLRDVKSRGGSLAMHALHPGQVLKISAPKNLFPLAHGRPDGGHSVLLAGGIGVTPILCMAQHLADAGGSFEMHYCARSRGRAAFVGKLSESTFSKHVHFHFDDLGTAGELRIGAVLDAQPPATHLYVCGPKGFMDAVLNTARAVGWSEDRLHFEFFSAEVVQAGTDGEFSVKLARSNKQVLVQPSESIVQALARCGTDVPTSCEQGICGTCLTAVLNGVPDHRDMFLTPIEQASNRRMLLCCSRSKTPELVLDL